MNEGIVINAGPATSINRWAKEREYRPNALSKGNWEGEGATSNQA